MRSDPGRRDVESVKNTVQVCEGVITLLEARPRLEDARLAACDGRLNRAMRLAANRNAKQNKNERQKIEMRKIEEKTSSV